MLKKALAAIEQVRFVLDFKLYYLHLKVYPYHRMCVANKKITSNLRNVFERGLTGVIDYIIDYVI